MLLNIEVYCASSRIRTCDGVFPQSGLKPDAFKPLGHGCTTNNKNYTKPFRSLHVY